ncbi:MAG: hypothetical protein IJ779_08315 [Ruminococcus sp.]|nr:hypothetical protein [Ruminococcus sp.]
MELTGGINGDESVNFLICHNTWQFRGAQTLISGGAPRAGNVVTSSGGGGGAVYSSTSVNVTKTVVTVPLTVYEDMLLGDARTAAICGISAKEQTQIFITCTFQLLGTADSTAPKLTVTVDGERVGTAPQITLGEGDRGTIAFTCPVQVSGGNHTVKILAENYAEISGTAEVSGQNISAHTVTADLTDWEYETDENSASVTGYSGDEVNVEIPGIMGGKTVKIIKESAFEGSTAETVYIPEGVEKIE